MLLPRRHSTGVARRCGAHMKFASAAVFCALWASGSAAADRSVYTPTNGPTCVDGSRKYFSAWKCPGPSGYTAEFFDEGNLAGFATRLSGKRATSESYSWRGADKVFGDLVEWRMSGGRPEAAVLRVWRAEVGNDAKDQEVQELAVFKVSPAGSCHFASVDARMPGANELARRLAANASVEECPNEE